VESSLSDHDYNKLISKGSFVSYGFVITLAWVLVMNHFCNSPLGLLPLRCRGHDFHILNTGANTELVEDGYYLTHPGTVLVAATVGWTMVA